MWEKGCTNGIRIVKNCSYFPMILWGYVLIWYTCGDHRTFVPQITR